MLELLFTAAVAMLVLFFLIRWNHHDVTEYDGTEDDVTEFFYDDRGIARCKTCTDATRSTHKVVYFDSDSAAAAVVRDEARHGSQMRSYYEPKCGFWHLTSQERRTQRTARRKSF